MPCAIIQCKFGAMKKFGFTVMKIQFISWIIESSLGVVFFFFSELPVFHSHPFCLCKLTVNVPSPPSFPSASDFHCSPAVFSSRLPSLALLRLSYTFLFIPFVMPLAPLSFTQRHNAALCQLCSMKRSQALRQFSCRMTDSCIFSSTGACSDN